MSTREGRGALARGLILALWAGLVAGVALGCAEEPEALAPGRCRTDVDCPGGERCIPEPGETVGRCGCLEDRHCAGGQICDRDARRCGCTEDGQCPAGLACDGGRCVCQSDGACNGVTCASDDDCPPPATCDPSLGVCRAGDPEALPACTCDEASSICVHPRGEGSF
ncbi:MAG: hypothetical protein H6701_17005, partial [Myxococcales bacterium]|nr:hypothetical protein [Myxococcales bacterium]